MLDDNASTSERGHARTLHRTCDARRRFGPSRAEELRVHCAAGRADLLIAAFDRTLTVPAPSTTKGPILSNAPTGPTPCSDFVKQAGVLGQVGQIGAGELTGATIGAGLEASFGSVTGGKLNDGLSALGTLAKIGKLIQQFRYGYVKLDLKTPSPIKKPLKDAAYKKGELTATAGVDPAKYEEKVAASGSLENSEQRQALADCYACRIFSAAIEVQVADGRWRPVARIGWQPPRRRRGLC